MTIDFHTHILPPWLRDQRDRWLGRDSTFGALYSDPKAKIASVEDLLKIMDEDDIDRAVVMGMGWTDAGLAREASDYIIEAVRDNPTRLTGFAGLNPAWGSEAALEVDRCARAGLRGVGELHPDTQGYDLGDEGVMTPLLEAAEHHGLIISTHSSEPTGHLYAGKGRTTPDVLWRFIQNAQEFPNVRIVCAHWGGGLPFYALMPEVKETLRNVYFDTATSPFLYTADVFSTVERLVGADKILFGSDYPLLRPRRLLKQLEESGLLEETQQTIRTSGLRLLGL